MILKHVFLDNDKITKDIIINVLENYCVPYKVETVHTFCIDLYNITVELEHESKNGKQSPYDFILSEVNKRLALENNFRGISSEPINKANTKLDKINYEGLNPFGDFNPLAFLDDIFSSFKQKKNNDIPVKVVKFENLPTMIKRKLLKTYSKEFLTSDNCIIHYGVDSTGKNNVLIIEDRNMD